MMFSILYLSEHCFPVPKNIKGDISESLVQSKRNIIVSSSKD